MRPNLVSHAIGLFKGLNAIFSRLQWAKSGPLVRSNSHVGPHSSLVQQLIVRSMANVSPLPIGPCEGLH